MISIQYLDVRPIRYFDASRFSNGFGHGIFTIQTVYFKIYVLNKIRLTLKSFIFGLFWFSSYSLLFRKKFYTDYDFVADVFKHSWCYSFYFESWWNLHVNYRVKSRIFLRNRHNMHDPLDAIKKIIFHTTSDMKVHEFIKMSCVKVLAQKGGGI